MFLFNSNKFSYYFRVVCLLHCITLLALSEGTPARPQRLRPPASDFNKHRIVQPVVHHGRTKREITTTRDTNGAHQSGVVMKVPIDDREFVLDLQLNKDLITDNHVLRYQEGGKTVTHKPKKEDIDLCQYSGTVRGRPGSWVAVSTCRGVRGVIFDGKQMRYIEPAEGDEIQSQHYVYEHSDLNEKRSHVFSSGGTNSTSYESVRRKRDVHRNGFKGYNRPAEDFQVSAPYSAFSTSRYVELVLVADHGEYIRCGRDIQKVHHKLIDIANLVNMVYAPLNISIALVGVEVWTQKDEILLSADSSTTLENFLRYRSSTLLRDKPNDNAHLLTMQHFAERVVGKAVLNAMCNNKFSGGITMDHTDVIGLLAMTTAHEMGHNLGMNHDDNCECAEKKCIMNPEASSFTPTKWSACSLQGLRGLVEKGWDHCLHNKPKSLFNSPTCGNGFVEPGEQCDCGTMVDRSAANPCHACCHPDTCMLRHNATCGAGACCDLQTCRLRSAGTQCRAAERECDLPEYCTGHSEFCPDNVYKMDTTPCGRNDDRAYCVSGLCSSHSSRCQLLWGPESRVAKRLCYTTYNIRGIDYGHCGYDNTESQRYYRPCLPQDAQCGVLYCNLPNDRSTCVVYKMDPKFSEIYPGMVPDGAKCGDEKMCLRQRCVPVAAVRATLDTRICPANCSGHGVCDSQGHCHCEPGFTAPLCTAPGPYDSTTTTIIIVILGAALLAVIIFVIYYYRQRLRLCFS